MRRSIWILGLAAMLVAIVGGSYLAYDNGLPEIFTLIKDLDKLVHFSVFGAVAFFLDGVLKRRAAVGRIPLAALIVILPAGIEEYLQRYSSNRSSDIWDFIADVAGVFAFIWFSRRVSLTSQPPQAT